MSPLPQASPASAPPAPGGLVGQILIGPVRPGPLRLDDPCPDQPYQATVSVLDQNGQPVTQFQSDAQGRFQVELQPGTYLLRPHAPNRMARAAELTVTVTSGQWVAVTITYDSGIR